MSEERSELDALEALREVGREEWAMRAMHRETYQRDHPPPEEPQKRGGITGAVVAAGLVAIAALFLAALRTGPAFAKIANLTVDPVLAIIEGALATIAIDGAVLVFRYLFVYQEWRARDDKAHLNAWIKGGLWIAAGTQLIAQIYSTSGVSLAISQLDPLFEGVIAIAAAVSAMAISVIAGEIVAIRLLQAEADRKATQTDYQQALDEWTAGMEAAYSDYRADIRRQLSKRKRRHKPAQTGTSAQGGTNPARAEPSPSQWHVIRHLAEHPDDMELNARDLANAVEGISSASRANEARNMARADPSLLDRVISNGHSRE